MEGIVWNEEQKLIDYGFSISVGNIVESSFSSSSSSSQYSPTGSENTNPPHVIISNVKNMNPGAFNKTSGARRKKTRRNSETQTVKTTNLTDDGYGWRKYGQKNIQKEDHPKSYYRCTHHKEEKCDAKKWVQQESENPPIYKTTYLGHHTCKNPHKIPQIFFPHYSPLSAENLSMASSTPLLIRFDEPATNNMFSVYNQDEQTMRNCDTSSSPPSIPSSSWSTDDSMMILEDQAGQEVDTYPPITSPNYSFGSYDLDMMIQELLAHDNVDFMQDYS